MKKVTFKKKFFDQNSLLLLTTHVYKNEKNYETNVNSTAIYNFDLVKTKTGNNQIDNITIVSILNDETMHCACKVKQKLLLSSH